MKRSVSFLLSLTILLPCLFLFSGCGQKGTDDDPETTSGFYTVTFVIGGTEYRVQAAKNETPVCPVTPPRTASDPNGINLNYLGWDKEIAAVTEDTVYTAQYGSPAAVLPAKDGAKGILTMTYDDGQYDTAKWVNEENKKYGLAGSCMMIAGRSSLTDNVEKWTALFADGTLEPQSHSMLHDTLPAEGSSKYADKKGNNTQPKYQYELVDSKKQLEELFPGRDILCFAPASNTLSTSSFEVDANGNADFSRPLNDGGAAKVAQATYYAIRQGARGIQSLNPTFGGEAGGWYNLKIREFSSFDGDAKLREGKGWLDETARDGGWLIIMCHGIDGPNAKGTSPLEISEADADAFFAYASAFVKSGKLWAATFGDATKYVRERQNTTVTERFENETVFVDMKINRTAKDGKYLAEGVFNYPLTVEVRVPDGWSKVTYKANGKSNLANVYTRNGCSYAMVNLVPGADGETVTTPIHRLGTAK